MLCGYNKLTNLLDFLPLGVFIVLENEKLASGKT